jgi:hypothetical protein
MRFVLTLSWKGEGSLWQTPEASADLSIFLQGLLELTPSSDGEPPPRDLFLQVEIHTLLAN